MTVPASVLALLRDLSALPYENLSKIVAFHEGGGGDLRAVERALDLSSDWLAHTRATGAGGTCFALTWWLALRMREQGFASAFLLADKGRGRAVHCGLRFPWEGRDYLLDPGYMIFEPLPLPTAGLSATAWCSPNEVLIEDISAGPPPAGPRGQALPSSPASRLVSENNLPGMATGERVWRLWSGPKGGVGPGLKWRFDFRQEEAGEEEFLRVWEASYALPMMGYPVLNRLAEGTQYYLQKRSLLVRTAEGSEMRKLDEAGMRTALAEIFGIPEGLAREALDIVVGRDPAFFRK
ncbi:MAG TPA: hypothetical protein VK465_03335 [Fibrobacteria bacterium]|nr:hypothetical protein [Fibrobacteria bacterium]